MGLFDKITHVVNLIPNTTQEQVGEYLFTPEEENEMRNLIQSSSNYLLPHLKDNTEFIIPLFNAEKHYQHFKKMIWKHCRR